MNANSRDLREEIAIKLEEKMLLKIYALLLKKFGNQYWWPVQGKNKELEISLGAILTQSTSWKNVEKAIKNLINNGLLDKDKLSKISSRQLASLIKSSGYYNQKAKKIKNFIKFLQTNDFEELRAMSISDARKKLLGVNGVGEETADSILLYALNKPIFVIDAYTKRIFSRVLEKNFNFYGGWQKFFHANLPKDARLFNEYHALLVALGKDFCRKKPLCGECPISQFCSTSHF